MVTREYSEAAVEVLGILNELNDYEFNKIPSKIIEFLENNKSNTYNPNIDYSGNIKDMKLKGKTREILAGIYLDYLCPESRKEAYLNYIRKNENKYQEKIKENYNLNNLFENEPKYEEVQKTEALVVQEEEGFFKKIISKIKKCFAN